MSSNPVIEAANKERYLRIGQRAEALKKLSEIENTASGLLIMIREQLDPTFELHQFNLDNTMALMKRLRQLQIEARDLEEKISEYNALIGNID